MTTETPAQVPRPERPAFSFDQLSATGVLWAINRILFHPRGYALSLEYADGETEPRGWSLQGDGSEPWTFEAGIDDDLFPAFNDLLAQASEHGVAPDQATDPR